MAVLLYEAQTLLGLGVSHRHNTDIWLHQIM